MSGVPFVVREADVPIESWSDPVRGEVRFRTLLDGAAGARSLVHGVAYLDPGKVERAHHHPDTDETIHILAGAGEARLADNVVPLARGDTVFVPAGAVHEWRAGPDGLSFFYSFAADRFETIAYVFEAGEPPA
jgi:quercetin dioxygenase-like cupin family protein